MIDRIPERFLSDRDRRVIEAAGYDARGASSWDTRGIGDVPLVLVIDMQRRAVGANVPILEAVREYPTAMGEVAWDAIDSIEPFLAFARERGVPVAHTRVVPEGYDDPDHEDLAIVDAVAPEGDEPVLDKPGVSAFHGTDLRSRLRRRGVDTLVIVGNSTSGCVRATAVDARQHGFDVVVPPECVFDRIEASHAIGLLDIWMKYGAVLDVEEVEAYIDGL